MTRVEKECARLELGLSAKKTKVITYNIPAHPPLRINDVSVLKEPTDFENLGSWVNNSEQYLKLRKALAWKALNGMTSVWKSNLP